VATSRVFHLSWSMFRRKIAIAVLILILAVAGIAFSPYREFARLWTGVIGVDVSHHQGAIDWPRLAKTDVRFAYLKATEGGDYVDPTFKDNWDQARKAGLAVGGYHFFTRCKTGAEQAKNFLAVLPVDQDQLPPVLDAEKMEPCDSKGTDLDPLKEIQAFIDAINAKLGCRPILYVTQEFDQSYLQNGLKDDRFWVRAILAPPTQRADQWLFWQYHDAGTRAGVDGPVDLDVFRGRAQDFQAFRKNSTCNKGTS
jgi:lysozyme